MSSSRNARRVLEKDVEGKVVQLMARYGLTSRKMNGPGFTGWPDRMFLLPGGTPLFVEFKRPGAVAYPRQLHIHAMLRHFGYEVQVHDDAYRAVEAICRAMEATRLSGQGSEVPVESRSGGVVLGPGAGEDQHCDEGTPSPDDKGHL